MKRRNRKIGKLLSVLLLLIMILPVRVSASGETAAAELCTDETDMEGSQIDSTQELPADAEALRRENAKKFISAVIAAWVLIITVFVVFLVVRKHRKKQDRELASTQKLVEQRTKELESALPDAMRQKETCVTLTDRRVPERRFQILPGSEAVAGRNGAFCKILLDYDPSVSARHCAISVEDHKVFVRDLDSTNGTFVNGCRVFGRTELRQGDVLVIGQLEMDVAIANC